MIRVTDFIEAVVTLLPREAGGRQNPVSPRDGSYRPFIGCGGERLRVRFIEGPPRLAPGDTGRVVLEVESSEAAGAMLVSGSELELFETDARAIGLVTVARLVRRALAL